VILSISRFCLGVEYLSVFWHIRKFRKAWLPIIFQIAISFAAGFVYLGVTFRFRNENSNVFVTWYMLATVEVVATTGGSAFWEVLSFTRTHLMRRLALLTVIILGDGVIVLAQDVVVISEVPGAWSKYHLHGPYRTMMN
jgi:low temperature requirement protein LtrA